MHPVNVTDHEVEQLKEARDLKNWRILDSWKLRYLYQRLVALPAKDIKTVKEIAAVAKQVKGESIEDIMGY